jgi:hypothetical protein
VYIGSYQQTGGFQSAFEDVAVALDLDEPVFFWLMTMWAPMAPWAESAPAPLPDPVSEGALGCSVCVVPPSPSNLGSPANAGKPVPSATKRLVAANV